MTYHIIAQVIFVHNEWTLNPAPSPRAPHLEKTRRRRQIREKEALARCLVFYGAADDVVAGEERASRRRANGRHDLYGRYMDEFATLFAEALKSDKVDYAKLIGAFALKGRIELMSSVGVVAAADWALKFVVNLTMGPAVQRGRPAGDDGRSARRRDRRLRQGVLRGAAAAGIAQA